MQNLIPLNCGELNLQKADAAGGLTTDEAYGLMAF